MSLKNRSLLIKAAGGDKKAIVKLWNLWTPRLTVYLCHSGVYQREDREDLQQEIMLKVYRTLDRYNPVFAPATWIYTIASNSLKDWKQKKNHTKAEYDESLLQLPSTEPTPESAFVKEETKKIIQNFIQQQDDRDKQILHLFCYENISVRETAKILNIPYETLRYRIKILKKHLKEELK